MKSLDSDIKFYGGRFLTALPMAAVVGRKDIIPLPYKEQRHSDRREESHTPTSRRDNTLITVGFNLRHKSNAPQVPQGRHLRINKVSSLRDFKSLIQLPIIQQIKFHFHLMRYDLGLFQRSFKANYVHLMSA